jgi:hypothetical protein
MRSIMPVIRSKRLAGWKHWGIYPDWGKVGNTLFLNINRLAIYVKFAHNIHKLILFRPAYSSHLALLMGLGELNRGALS